MKPITEEEFEPLPGFVKTQLDVAQANHVLEALRECIEASELLPKEVRLSPQQLQ